MNAYRYLFFRVYEWGRRTHGIADLPEYNAILGLSLLATISIFNILMLVDLVAGRNFATGHAKLLAVSLWLVSVVLHYSVLIRGNRLQRITEEFRDPSSARPGMAATWVYPACTLLLFFVLLIVRF